jgi:hypothetical protein
MAVSVGLAKKGEVKFEVGSHGFLPDRIVVLNVRRSWRH